MASNTGSKAGACILLQQKPLVSMVCRHHIHELIVAQVFNLLMGCSSIYYQTFWMLLTSMELHRQIQTGKWWQWCCSHHRFTKRMPYPILSAAATRIPSKRWLKGVATARSGFCWWSAQQYSNAAETYHRARWMAKIIYSLKIYLYRSQFRLTTAELHELQSSMPSVTMKCYLEACFQITLHGEDIETLMLVWRKGNINRTVSVL